VITVPASISGLIFIAVATGHSDVVKSQNAFQDMFLLSVSDLILSVALSLV